MATTPHFEPSAKSTSWWLLPALVMAVLIGAGVAYTMKPGKPPETPPPAPSEPVVPSLIWIPGGTFLMGSDDVTPRFRDAKPIHEVTVKGFFMDKYEVTNRQFAEFIKATGYKTIAERAPDKAEIMAKAEPGAAEPDAAILVPGSLVFTPPPLPVSWDSENRWWSWVPGACWNHPDGPKSNLEGREDHPVVHIAWDDAVEYCKWAGKRLPTEAEWEFAARGGLVQKQFAWGDDAHDAAGKFRCNIWQGEFPHFNSKLDGYDRTAPVGRYDANGYGLHDMAGNVWEWCQDWYMPEYYSQSPKDNPRGPPSSADPLRGNNPMRVQRGGSFLCSDLFCARYKPGGRGRGDPLTGMSHVGFRCVQDAK